MDNETKERIIELNKRLGLKTEFIIAEDILGYAEKNTIYINESVNQDYERTNKHEILHFFEDTPEFETLKQTVLLSVEKHLDQIRAEYELRYFGIYSEDEISAGVLDNEIVIDLLVDNSIIKYEDGLVVGDKVLGDIYRGLEEKRYLNLSVRRNVQNMNLSDWEKIFVENYYDGKKHVLPKADKQNGIKREDVIGQDIEAYLEQLFTMGEEEFLIDSHSPEVIREYESEIKALQARGKNTSSLEDNKEMALQKIADEHSKHLFTEYKHIADQIKEMDFEPSYKALMLRETLMKTYKLEKDNDGKKTIVKNRDMHKSIAGHMILNAETLNFIYQHRDNIKEYGNFANLYFAALEVYNKSIAEKSRISLENVDTFGKGQWIKFEGKESNEEQYLENAEKLASLVKDTPWCTKTLASTQLADGDFFVFVDENNKPHIAVRMAGNTIAEVRGIENGWEQGLEEEYREVAISFLDNNKKIKNGKKWLEREEWNKRLVEYRRSIEKETFTVEDVPMLIQDLCREGYMDHYGVNQNRLQLIKEIELVKDIIADYYRCSEDQIYIGDIDFAKFDERTYEYEEDEQNDRPKGRNVAFKKNEIRIIPIIIIGDAYFYGVDENDFKENLRKIRIVTGDTYGLADLIKSVNDTEYIKSCIERREELGLDSDNTYNLIESINDTEYIKSCIERREELGLNSDNTYYLIESINDAEYTKSCIERREELGLDSNDTYYLIESINDAEYTKSCIERRKKLGLDFNQTYNLIKIINDAEYTKSCIERREELGLSSDNTYNLIISVNDAEYTKSCIERREELGLSSDNTYNLIISVHDIEYIKSCIDRSKELGLDFKQIDNIISSLYLKRNDKIYLLKSLKNPEYIKSIIAKIPSYDEKLICELIVGLNDAEYTKSYIEKKGSSLTKYNREYLIVGSKDIEYIIQMKSKENLNEHDIVDYICTLGDKDYTKKCIDRWSEDLGIYYEDDEWLYYDDSEEIRLIKSLKDIEYTKQCIEREEELGLTEEGIQELVEFVKQLEKERDELSDSSEKTVESKTSLKNDDEQYR